MSENRCYAATHEELKLMRRKCWTPHCVRTAWLNDWTGWKHCLRCWLRNWRYSGGNAESKWLRLKSLRIF